MIKIRKRSTVLRYALNLEHVAAGIAAYLLDIQEPRFSYSFGNKSSALSFNQKLNLLLDNDSITKEEKIKLEAFSNIRNQFMHNVYANSYTNAFDAIDGLENKMKKLYPENFGGLQEENLEKCVKSLYVDGIKILTIFKGGMRHKMSVSADATTYKMYYEKLSDSIRKNLNMFESALKETDKNEISKSGLLDTIRLMKIEILSSPLLEMNLFGEEES